MILLVPDEGEAVVARQDAPAPPFRRRWDRRIDRRRVPLRRVSVTALAEQGTAFDLLACRHWVERREEVGRAARPRRRCPFCAPEVRGLPLGAA